MKLNPEQEALLDAVADADSDYRNDKLNLERTLRQQLDQALAKSARRRDIAAYLATVAGVPMSRVGKEGLHTGDPKTAKDAVNRGRELYGEMLTPAAATTLNPNALPHEVALAAATPTKPAHRFTLVSQVPDPFEFEDKKSWDAAGWKYPADDPQRVRYTARWEPDDDKHEPLTFTFYSDPSDDRPHNDGWQMRTAIIKDSDWHSGIPEAEMHAWVSAVLDNAEG